MKKKIATTILIILSVLFLGFCTLNDKGYLDGLFAGYKIGNKVSYKAGYKAGKQSQIKDNIKHGVMDANGKWLPKHKLAR